MRNISFALTEQQVRDRTKTVTRRIGWKTLKPATVLRGVEKAQGLKKGEHVVPLCTIKVVDVRREPLSRISDSRTAEAQRYGAEECAREGFPRMTPAAFVMFFMKSHPGCHPDTEVTRIEFEYVETA